MMRTMPTTRELDALARFVMDRFRAEATYDPATFGINLVVADSRSTVPMYADYLALEKSVAEQLSLRDYPSHVYGSLQSCADRLASPFRVGLALAMGATSRDVRRVAGDVKGECALLQSTIDSNSKLGLFEFQPSCFAPDQLALFMETDEQGAFSLADDEQLAEIEEVMGHRPPFDVYADARRLYKGVVTGRYRVNTLSQLDRRLVDLMWRHDGKLTEPMLAAWRDEDLDSLGAMLMNEKPVYKHDTGRLEAWSSLQPRRALMAPREEARAYGEHFDDEER
ncbi:MAG: hypothetical protein Q4B30_06645 [Coriobacteriaceae bacterium]|nr:hypothetical protein [Coriobacteriaceae bacterium]